MPSLRRNRKMVPSGVQVVWLGDVVRIPFDGERSAVAQVVAHYGGDVWYMAIFESAWSPGDTRPIRSLTQDRIVFLVSTFDSLVACGEWEVIGKAKPVEVGLPMYKIDLLDPDEGIDGTYLVFPDGSTGRQATPEEAAHLSYREMIEPRGVETLLRAQHGLEPWPFGNRFLYDGDE